MEPDQPTEIIAAPTQPTPQALARHLSDRLGDVLGNTQARLVNAWLGSKKETTVKAYEYDLVQFRHWLCERFSLPAETKPAEAAEVLTRLSQGDANATVLAWVEDMRAKGLREPTIARRIAALKSLVKMARTLGLSSTQIEVNVKAPKPYKDTRGPGLEMVKAAFELAGTRQSPRRERDLVIFSLMFHQGLRRGEIAALDIDDLDPPKLWITGKGSREEEAIHLAEKTAGYIDEWLHVRPETADSALLLSLRPSGPPQRLSSRGLYYILETYAKELEADQRFHPHGIRHTAITEVLDRSGGNIAAAQQFSRHRDPKTTMAYLDNLKGKYAEAVDLLEEI